MEQFQLILNYLVIPLLGWIWNTDRKVLLVRTQLDSLEKQKKEQNEDLKERLDTLYKKLDELTKEIHTKNSCTNSCSS